MSLENHRHTSGPEHDFEPQHGLPQTLPPGEHLLWQGAPEFWSLARKVFHVRKLAVYFGLMLALRVAVDVHGGAGAIDLLASTARFAGLAGLALGLVLGVAWLTARTTVYTLTERRLVMRIGIVLSVSYNLPLSRIESAALRLHADGSGHLPLVLSAPNKISYLHLWPHARGWRLARPEPMLLSVANAQGVAILLGEAWATVHGRVIGPLPAPATTAGPSPDPLPTDASVLGGWTRWLSRPGRRPLAH